MSVAQGTGSDNVRIGVAAILATNFALSLGDAAIKFLSANFVLWQIFVLRAVFAVPLLVAIIVWRLGAAALAPRRIGWVALRSLMLCFMWVAYYACLPHLELGVAAAAYNTLPIFITLFAALFIGDRIGPVGWLAIFLGFAGVLLILRPEASGFNWYALLPLAAAVLYALAMILTRTKCRGEQPLVLSLSLNVTFVVVGLLATLGISAIPGLGGEAAGRSFLTGEWAGMGGAEWLAMAVLAVIAIIGSVGAAVAYQMAPPATVATFDFSYLGFSALWGILFFAEVLDFVTILGIILIVVAGVMAVRR